jgi:hypothetical protein
MFCFATYIAVVRGEKVALKGRSGRLAPEITIESSILVLLQATLCSRNYGAGTSTA